MSTVALLFPGQGNQRASMLSWLDAEPAARPLLDALARTLDEPDWRARAESDAAWLRTNRVAQSIVTATNLAAFAVLAPRLPRIVAVAGYSVGELASYAAAGALDAGRALALAAIRADAMDHAAQDVPGGLISVAEVDVVALETGLEGSGLAIAIRLGPTRCIVGGARAALQAFATQQATVGATVKRLAVDVASHTPLMASAAAAFSTVLRDVEFIVPALALVSGIEGAVLRDRAALRDALARQLDSTVRWDACLDAVAERRPDRVLEVGGGSALAAMWRQAWPGIPSRSADEFVSADDIAEWLRG